MRVYNNERIIRRRARVAQIANLGGMAVLAAGLVISLTKPEWALFTLVFLIIGVIASQYGIATAYRYARKPRLDEELASALKGLDDRYRLYNYVLPAYHVLLSPKRVYALVAKGIGGRIICEGRRFRHAGRFSLGRLLRFFSPEFLGDPVREAEWDKAAVEEWIRQHVDGVGVTVEPLIVFLNPRAELEIRNPEVRAVRAKNLKSALRGGDGPTISSDAYRRLARAFEDVVQPGKPD